jgi:hypothetical protein
MRANRCWAGGGRGPNIAFKFESFISPRKSGGFGEREGLGHRGASKYENESTPACGLGVGSAL